MGEHVKLKVLVGEHEVVDAQSFKRAFFALPPAARAKALNEFRTHCPDEYKEYTEILGREIVTKGSIVMETLSSDKVRMSTLFSDLQRYRQCVLRILEMFNPAAADSNNDQPRWLVERLEYLLDHGLLQPVDKHKLVVGCVARSPLCRKQVLYTEDEVKAAVARGWTWVCARPHEDGDYSSYQCPDTDCRCHEG